MNTMEFKGVTWVGDIYQKFEALCLEVEETMYQDTVKFVENQVQTMGSNMKKFYSDVMQDLVPPSSTDPVKVAAVDLPLNSYADAGIPKKQKARIKEDTKKVDKIFSKEFKVIDGVDRDQVSSRDGLHPLNHIPKLYFRGSMEGSYTIGSKDGEKCEHNNMCGKKLSKRDCCHVSKKTSSNNLILENRNIASSIFEIIQDYAANDHLVMASPRGSVAVIGCNSKEEERRGKSRDDLNGACLLIDDCSIDAPMCDVILSPKSKGKKGRIPRCVGDGLAAESLETCSPIDSYVNGDAQNSRSAGEQGFLFDSGNSGNCTDVIENNDSAEPRMETMKHDDKLKLEETCVLVNGNSLSFVSLEEGRHRSYKKKMREVFSLKRKSARKQEYEQLLTHYGDADTRSSLASVDNATSILSPNSNAANLLTHEFCETEWELL